MLRLDSHTVYAVVTLILIVRTVIVVLMVNATAMTAYTAWLFSLEIKRPELGTVMVQQFGRKNLVLLMQLQSQTAIKYCVDGCQLQRTHIFCGVFYVFTVPLVLWPAPALETKSANCLSWV